MDHKEEFVYAATTTADIVKIRLNMVNGEGKKLLKLICLLSQLNYCLKLPN